MDLTDGDFHAMRGALGSMRRLSRFMRPQPERVAATVSQALLDYVFDTASAASVLLEHHHPEQAAVVIRALVSAAATLRVIWKEPANSNAIALQYLLFSQRARTKRFQTLVAQHEMEEDLANRLDAEEQGREAQLLERIRREHQISAMKLGTRSDTWSGLTDRELIYRAWGDQEWYADYSDMSNASHANVAGIWHRLLFGEVQLPEIYSASSLADAVVELTEDASTTVAKGLKTDQEEAIGMAATSFWWDDREEDEGDFG